MNTEFGVQTLELETFLIKTNDLEQIEQSLPTWLIDFAFRLIKNVIMINYHVF